MSEVRSLRRKSFSVFSTVSDEDSAAKFTALVMLTGRRFPEGKFSEES